MHVDYGKHLLGWLIPVSTGSIKELAHLSTVQLQNVITHSSQYHLPLTDVSCRRIYFYCGSYFIL